MQSLFGVVMVDVAIAAIALEAVYWLARYAQSSSRRDAIFFGVFAACACLTKGTGVAVVLVPPVFILITGRYDLLRKSGLYLAAAIVVIFAVPLLAASARLDAAIGDFGPVTMSLVIQRLQFYSGHLLTQMSPLLLALSLAGVAIAVRRGRAGRVSGALLLEPALAALVLAALIFHVLNPHIVSVTRYLTIAIGPLIGLALAAVWLIADRVKPANQRPAVRILIASAVILVAVMWRPDLRVNKPLGYQDIITRLAERGELAGRRLLVVSDEVGEGAFVTEAAILGLTPSPTMIRGSKLLASDNWLGHEFRMRYASPAAVLLELEALHIDYVVLDSSEASKQLPYFDQVQMLAKTEPSRFALDYARPADSENGPRRSLALYRMTTRSDGPPKPLEIDLKYSLGRSLVK